MKGKMTRNILWILFATIAMLATDASAAMVRMEQSWKTEENGQIVRDDNETTLLDIDAATSAEVNGGFEKLRRLLFGEKGEFEQARKRIEQNGDATRNAIKTEGGETRKEISNLRGDLMGKDGRNGIFKRLDDSFEEGIRHYAFRIIFAGAAFAFFVILAVWLMLRRYGPINSISSTCAGDDKSRAMQPASAIAQSVEQTSQSGQSITLQNVVDRIEDTKKAITDKIEEEARIAPKNMKKELQTLDASFAVEIKCGKRTMIIRPRVKTLPGGQQVYETTYVPKDAEDVEFPADIPRKMANEISIAYSDCMSTGKKFLRGDYRKNQDTDLHSKLQQRLFEYLKGGENAEVWIIGE